MRASSIAFALLLCLVCVPRRATPQAVIEPGTPIRITAPCGAPAPRKGAPPTCRSRGELVTLARDSISITTTDSIATYALGGIDLVEARAGTRGHPAAGAVIGFVAGTAVTYMAFHTGGSNSLCDTSRNQDAIRPLECLGVASLGGLGGALLGGVVGAFVRTDAWRPVPIERLRVGWLPRHPVTAAVRLF